MTLPCPMCAANVARVVYEQAAFNKRWALARCRRCGLYYTDPAPTEEDLARFYEGDYHTALRTEGVTEAAFGPKYRRYASALGRHLRSGRVVDVGCATGLFVRILCDLGYEAEGVELSQHDAEWGRTQYGVTIHTEPLERCPYPARSLDAIALTDVLEHTLHPREFLRAAGRLLRPGGLVLVTFPDIASVESWYYWTLSRLLRRDWLWKRCCHIPKHTWEFTRSTAEACFAGAGFEVVEFRRSQAAGASDSAALWLLAAPVRPLAWSPIGRWLGTQMEFVIRRV